MESEGDTSWHDPYNISPLEFLLSLPPFVGTLETALEDGDATKWKEPDSEGLCGAGSLCPLALSCAMK